MSSLVRSAGIIVALAFCSCISEDGNGRVITTLISNVRSFSRVAVQDGIQVSIARGEPSVRLTSDENLRLFYEFDVDGRTLKIRQMNNFRLTPSTPVMVEITNPELEGLDVSGGSQVSAEATPAGDWRLTVKEGSSASLSRLETQNLHVDASGSSRVDVFGRSRDVNIKSSGGSQVSTDGVSAAHVKINASGGSLITVNALESVKIDASGGSQVTVTGNPPERTTDTTDGSQVNFFNQ